MKIDEIIHRIEHRLTQLNLAGYADPMEELKEIYSLMLELAKKVPEDNDGTK